MGGPPSPRRRAWSAPLDSARTAWVRIRRAPGAGRRRFDELVRRDDVQHHLLWTLLGRLDALSAENAELQRRLDALERSSAEVEAAVARAVDADEATRELLDERTSWVRTDLAALAVQHASSGVALPDDAAVEGPLVSIVLPTWQRAAWLPAAIGSVLHQTYRRWELIVVDDGSDDGTAEVVAGYLDDPRIRLLRVEHQGASAARNHGLDHARGELVAYLDSDNEWHPAHLDRHVAALANAPEAWWSIAGRVLVDGRTGRSQLQPDLRATESLVDGNFVDLNVVAHRREALDRIGRFDPDLPRLGDWDLALRLAGLGRPARTGATTVLYRIDAPDRITDTQPGHVVAHRIRARYRGRPAEGLRVLLAEWHFPQLTETYIAALASGLEALGATVEAWAEVDVSAAAPTHLPVHRGPLAEVLDRVRPDVVVTHWEHIGEAYRPTTAAAGVPHVIRTHGFEHDPARVGRLLADEGVVVHTYPHLMRPEWAGHPRLSPHPTCFDDVRWGPVADKDPLLVVRTAAGLHTKDLDTFLLAAGLCPRHRFVLVLGHALEVEHRTDELIARAKELRAPVEILVDLPYDEVTELVGRAGIYLHTHGTDHPVTMPVSIAEALATGCWVLGRDLPGMGGYVEPAGSLYRGTTVRERAEHAATLVEESLCWSPRQWAAVRQVAADQAFARHASRDVAEQMVRHWRSVFPQLRR